RPPAHARLAEELSELGAEVVHVSGSLADRTALRRELEGVDAEVFLTEIKAAAIDVVADAGARRGIQVVLVANEIVPVTGQPELEPALLALADQAQAEPVAAAGAGTVSRCRRAARTGCRSRRACSRGR